MLSLSELNGYIKQVIALNFEKAVRVRAEINQVNESRGHLYLDLIEKKEGSEEIVARQSGVIWRSTAALLQRKHGTLFRELLKRGNEISLSCKVDFHSKFGLKLIIQDIDPSFTLGKLEMERQATLAYVKKEGLIGRNALLPLPPVIAKIAVISSREAAGWADFYRHIREHSDFFRYQIHFYHSPVQGKEASRELIRRLQAIDRKHDFYDCTLIMRGGGSKLDLSAFDDRLLADSIAQARLPVIVAVGHEIDQSVADLVAHTSLKTPTAAAEWLSRHNTTFVERVNYLAESIRVIADRSISNKRKTLEVLKERVQWTVSQRIADNRQKLKDGRTRIEREIQRQLEVHKSALTARSEYIEALDPSNNLKRGYSLVASDKGRILRSVKTVQPEDQLRVRMYDGTLGTIVKNVHHEE